MKKIRGKIMMQLKNLKSENRTVGLNPLEPRSNKRLYQYGALFVAIIMVFSSIGYATIKLGEDASGQKWFGADPGLITNSNGKAWTATGAGIQDAIWDLNTTGGDVYLPSGNIDLNRTIYVGAETAIVFTESTMINLVENVDGFVFGNSTNCGSSLRGNGGSIWSYNLGNSHTKSLITVKGTTEYGDSRIHIDNVRLVMYPNLPGNPMYSTGIDVVCDDNSGNLSWLFMENVIFYGGEYGIRQRLNTTAGNSRHMAGISCKNLAFNPCAKYCISQEYSKLGGTGSIGGQVFKDVYFGSNEACKRWIYFEGGSNIVTGRGWDYDGALGGKTIELTYSSCRNYIELYGIVVSDSIINNGSQNVIIDLTPTSDAYDFTFPSINNIRFASRFDSVNSTTDGIQEAINSLDGNGGIVFLPSGIYNVNSTINLTSSVTIQGCGEASIVKADLYTCEPIFYLLNAHNVIFKDFKIEADNINDTDKKVINVVNSRYFLANNILFDIGNITSDGKIVCINSCNYNNHTIKNCVFDTDGTNTFFFIDIDSDNAIVEKCKFYSNYTGSRGQIFFHGCSSCRISDNVIHNGSIKGQYSNNFCIDGNTMFGHDACSLAIYLTNCDESIVSKNMVNDYVYIVFYFVGEDRADLSIVNNMILNSNAHEEGVIMVTGNAGIYRKIIISDNIIENTYNGKSGIRITKCESVSISDNTIRTNNSNAVTFNTGNGNISVVTNNVIDSSGIDNTGMGINSVILNNIGYNHNSLFPFYEQNTAPTITDNCTAYWYDTDDDYMYQITNSYGTVWYVNMTTTI